MMSPYVIGLNKMVKHASVLSKLIKDLINGESRVYTYAWCLLHRDDHIVSEELRRDDSKRAVTELNVSTYNNSMIWWLCKAGKFKIL